MTQTKILHIETATSVCSVALSEGENILASREVDEDKSHGSKLTVFMKEVMEEANVLPENIDAIAVSKGPGSYTGLRIGVSVTKGFAYARNIPVIGIVTLQAMAAGALQLPEVKELRKAHPKLLLCPMIDARRMEVFSAIYTAKNEVHSPVAATIIDEESFLSSLETNPILFFGNGAFKIKGVITHPNTHIIEGIDPSAKNMLQLALKSYEKKEFENTAYFKPFYLKDFVATTPKKRYFD